MPGKVRDPHPGTHLPASEHGLARSLFADPQQFGQELTSSFWGSRYSPQTSAATVVISSSFAFCSSAVSALPCSVDAKPHWPDRHS